MGLQKIEKTIHELRLLRGMTVQTASKLSGISAASIKRYEQRGTGKVPAITICKLLMVYSTNMDHLDISGVPTRKQIFDAILSGSCTAMPNGEIEVNLDKVVVLMNSEGFDTSAFKELYEPAIMNRRNAHTVQSESA